MLNSQACSRARWGLGAGSGLSTVQRKCFLAMVCNLKANLDNPLLQMKDQAWEWECADCSPS